MVGVLVGTWICPVTHIPWSGLDIGGGVIHIIIRDCNIAWDSTTRVSGTGDCIMEDCVEEDCVKEDFVREDCVKEAIIKEDCIKEECVEDA